MKSKKRALRRHHRERKIRYAWRSYVLHWIEDPERQRDQVRRWWNNLKKCSCFMCGNPRRFGGGPTLQERRQLAGAMAEGEEWLP